MFLFYAASVLEFLTLLLLSTSCSVPVSSGGAELVIRQGGTYSGRYESLSSDRPCILIATTEPVVLDGCELRGPGRLIDATAGGARLTVRNCRGFGRLPTVNNRARGRFLEIENGVSLRAEHNYLEHTAGMLVFRWQGSGSPEESIIIRYNQARNIDGRFRNGGGAKVSFVQLNEVHGLENVNIGWNEVVNLPDESMVEDNINLHNSSGTARSPLLVHHNYVQGAYPVPATAARFTGSGITTDGDASSVLTTTAYVEAHHNTVVSTCNAAMNIAAGHHNYFHHNYLLTSGLLPDGSRLRATYAATAIFNAYDKPETVFFANRMADNTIGFVNWGRTSPLPDRHDLSTDACATCTGTIHLPNPITLRQEGAAHTAWLARLHHQVQYVGPSASALARTPSRQQSR